MRTEVLAIKDSSVGSNLCLLGRVCRGCRLATYRVRTSVLASKEQCWTNLCKAVGAWQPTGFEDVSIGSSVGSNLCLLKSVGAVGWQPTGFEDVSIGIKRAVLGPTCAYLSL